MAKMLKKYIYKNMTKITIYTISFKPSENETIDFYINKD